MKSNSAQYIYFSALMVCMGHLSGIAYHDVSVLGVYLVLIKLLIYLRTLHIFWRAYYIYIYVVLTSYRFVISCRSYQKRTKSGQFGHIRFVLKQIIFLIGINEKNQPHLVAVLLHIQDIIVNFVKL